MIPGQTIIVVLFLQIIISGVKPKKETDESTEVLAVSSDEETDDELPPVVKKISILSPFSGLGHMRV